MLKLILSGARVSREQALVTHSEEVSFAVLFVGHTLLGEWP